MEIRNCHWPWFEAFIHVNGDVKPCCFASAPVANLFEDGDLEAIWTGPAMEEVRTFVKENRLHPVCVGATCVYVKDRVVSGADLAPLDDLKRLQAMADSGSGFAAVRYAQELRRTGRNEEAEKYLRLGVKRRSAYGQFHLAEMLLERGDPSSVQEALSLLSAAAAFQHPEATALLGKVYSDTAYGGVNPERAKKYLYDAISLGDASGMYTAARLQNSDFWGEVNRVEYIRLLKLAVSRGHVQALQELELAMPEAVL